MKVVDLVTETGALEVIFKCLKRKKKVDASLSSNNQIITMNKLKNGSSSKRYSLVVGEMQEEIAADVMTRQLGEESSMLIAALSVLPFIRDTCLFSISPLPSSLGQPSNQAVFLCVVCIALTLETVSTIWTFVMLARAGICVHNRTLPLDAISLCAFGSGGIVLCLMLAAAMV